MIHIIENHLAADKRPLLQSMFADRKRLFVDLFGWDVPVVDGQYEMDEFDTAGAVYLVIADAGGGHAASPPFLSWEGGEEGREGKQDKGSLYRDMPSHCLHILFSRDCLSRHWRQAFRKARFSAISGPKSRDSGLVRA
ncbi:acyl-homoserine-lactone synthase [Sphingomonas fennica]|uniref:acyl-homoserine-lactone synthase n=1 Tax=Edaphosphingomonas fennica TaxID=114404 RepID=UPI000D1B917B|nr:acyl-homoserine-lactone synthase [Sphingomonas fennica]